MKMVSGLALRLCDR